jgi:hypothetical protein
MASVRSILFDSLRKELLGPRKGTFEDIGDNPKGEYVVGILEPATFVRAPLEYYRTVDFSLGDDEIREDDDVADYDVDNLSLNLGLDPRALPKSMGISFVLSAETSPFIDLLVTWARYKKVEKKKWKRTPDHVLLRRVDAAKNARWEKEGVRIELRTSVIKNEEHYVSIYLVNDTPLEDRKYAATEDLVFQPQIRVNCCKGTKPVPVRGQQAGDDDESNLSFLYLDRPTLTRGHMCGALWKEIDPERPLTDLKRSSEPSVENPFVSIEEGIVEKKDEEYFTNPDIRTEFTPCYSIEQVKFEPKEDYVGIPELRAEHLSEAWDRETLERTLGSIVENYEKWISDQKQAAVSLPRQYRDKASRLLEKCRESKQRIENGLNLLKEDENLRLSFCFMNKVMDVQSRWKHNRSLTWRLFQIAFILQNIQGIMNRNHIDRKTCDLLWFPTAGGKTEAYLGLLVLVLALRRRKSRGEIHDGAGTAVISRYTLRMLTIQQFRRALMAIVACEYLRTINWRPKGYHSKEETRWGTNRFSIGLWVGGEVTPNHLLDHKRFDTRTYRTEYFPGALGRLRGFDLYRKKGYRVIKTTENEPAQVLECPACKTILAMPEKRVLKSGSYKIYWVISASSQPKVSGGFDGSVFRTQKIRIIKLPSPKFYVLEVSFSTSSPIGAHDVSNWWETIVRPRLGPGIVEAFARASHPGYFIRKWDVTKEDVDFEIHCPNPSCDLNSVRWKETIRGNDERQIDTPPLDAFSIAGSDNTSYSLPISAFVVDDQIYHRCPSLIVATVDKFARLPFEPRAKAIFGSVNMYDSCWGFYRDNTPPDRSGLHEGETMSVPRFRPPELVIQDELHLIEGPLGSMVGIYESAIEELSSEKIGGINTRPKYIASSATIQKAMPHVKAVFDRDVSVFPPPGISIEDNFFSHTREAHPLASEYPGRLYVGVCAPGRGPHTPTIRIWCSLMQKTFELRNTRGDTDEVDQFWTLVGYFNALRELASATSLYKIDMVERLRQTNTSPRTLEPSLELSSQMDSSEIPVALNQLSKALPENIVDAVLATSMFGTGVDIDRLGLMVVHGQPKTTANYIQATGRVGRKRGGLVVAFYRSTRPRDLDHYEFFSGYHRCLHKYVEPISANPFSPRARERALGPIMVAFLRNAEEVDGIKVSPDWSFEEVYTGSSTKVPVSGSRAIRQFRKSAEVRKVVEILEKRSQSQPVGRKPRTKACETEAESLLDRWKAAADSFNNLLYAETTMTKVPQYPVVLGDAQHESHGLPIVFEKTPQSLRDVEPTTRFEG